jgi:hypothetical protein
VPILYVKSFHSESGVASISWCRGAVVLPSRRAMVPSRRHAVGPVSPWSCVICLGAVATALYADSRCPFDASFLTADAFSVRRRRTRYDPFPPILSPKSPTHATHPITQLTPPTHT